MIGKLKKHSVEELREETEKLGFGDVLSVAITEPLPPTDEEIIAKINEVIEHINRLEVKNERNQRLKV